MVDNPYRGAPARSFWSRSVAADFAVESVSDAPAFRLGPDDRFMSAGSCFAANISRYLKSWGYDYVVTESPHPLWEEGEESGFYRAFSAAYGNVYTPRQMLQLVERATGAFSPEEECWTASDGTLVDPFRPGLAHRAMGLVEFRALRRQHLGAVLAALQQSTVFVFTLGLTEAWISSRDGAVFPACPGTVAGAFDPERHVFHNFTVAEIVDDTNRLISALRAVNPGLKIILTVSPVPLVATATTQHVLAATTYSKSVLRVAAQVSADTNPAVAYFPAYEIVTGPQNATSAFESDLRTVREPVVASIMAGFHAAFFGGRPPSDDAERGVGVSLDTSGPAGVVETLVSQALAAQCEEMYADESLRAANKI